MKESHSITAVIRRLVWFAVTNRNDKKKCPLEKDYAMHNLIYNVNNQKKIRIEFCLKQELYLLSMKNDIKDRQQKAC